MKAIILAGGLGTRLRPVTYEIPKPLLPVKKKPIINHLIDLFLRYGVNEIAILASRGHEEDFLRWQSALAKDLPQGNVSIFFEDKPRGTFGGLELLRDWIGKEKFILSNGDELKEFDLKKLLDFHEKYAPLGTIALVRVINPSEYGVPVLDGHRIKEFLEKPERPPSDFVSSGLYVLSPEILGYADFKEQYLTIEKDIFPKVAASGKLYGLKLDGARWYDCGNLERWERAIKEW